MAECVRNADSAELWDTEQGRRFLAALLARDASLAMRHSSVSNDHYALWIARLHDEVLGVLRVGREQLGAIVEGGLRRVEFLTEEGDGHALRSPGTNITELQNTLRLLDKLRRPWPALVRTNDMLLRDAAPQRVLVVFGPGLGIGTELICIRIAKRLRVMYRTAHIEVCSLREGLWNFCTDVDRAWEEQSQLAGFVRAHRLLRQDPTALVIIVDVFAGSCYRELESVNGFRTYLSLDVGSESVYVVDQRTSRFCEFRCSNPVTKYVAIDDLLSRTGLPRVFVPPAPVRLSRPSRVKRVFVNPFTGKVWAITAEWWSRVLNMASRRAPLSVTLFGGVNPATEAYSADIASRLHSSICDVRIYGGPTHPPTIAETINELRANDVVLGLDTFTSHVAVLERLPGVTIFIGPRPNNWIVPNAPVINVATSDDPEYVGRLLGRIVSPVVTQDIYRHACDITDTMSCLREAASGPGTLADVTFLYRRFKWHIEQLFRLDHELCELFPEAPTDFTDALDTALVLHVKHAAEQVLCDELERVFAQWADSNVIHYASYIASCCSWTGDNDATRPI